MVLRPPARPVEILYMRALSSTPITSEYPVAELLRRVGDDTKDWPMEEMLADTPLVPRYFRKYTIPRSKGLVAHKELEAMGVCFSNVYPDLGGLAAELRARLGPAPAQKYCSKCGGKA